MNRFRFLVFLPLFMLIGCAHRQPTTTFGLIDTSLSLSPCAQQAALNVVRGQIQRMGRGDRLILIPVTGNAQNDAGSASFGLERRPAAPPTMPTSTSLAAKTSNCPQRAKISKWFSATGPH